MNIKLRDLLKKVEGEINPEKQLATQKIYERALSWESTDRLPIIVSYPYPVTYPFQPFPHREVFDDPEKMLFNELVHGFGSSIVLHQEINDDLPFTVRPNFGTVIIASLFGGKVEQRDDNPPWVRHFETTSEFLSIFDCDPFDYSKGVCPKVIETYHFFSDVLSHYPNLKRAMKVVLPDLQGPLDSLELLRGSTIYEDFIMEPERIDKGMHLMAQAQVGFAKYLQQFVTDGSDGYKHQHATAIKGNILIRNDSAIMISPEMYGQQVASHDEFVLKEMGGGGVHSCGKIDFNIPEIFKLDSLKCFDFGQSYMNDLDAVYPLARERKIPLLRIRPRKEELLSGEIKERFPTGISLVYDALSMEDAKEVLNTYMS